MKKTLNNIFDEATANELEKLVSQNAAPDVSADTLSSIKNKVYAKTGITQTKTKKSIAFRWQSYVAVAACLLLIVGGIFGAPSIMKLFNNNVEPSIVDQELPTDIDKILWAGNGQSNPSDPDDADAFVEWNGWSMDYSLYEVLNRADKTDFIAVVVSKNNSIDRDSFEYKGTTYGQLRAEQDDLHALREKYVDFPKMSEWLKYGELLYTTGTPDGEKWTKELYDNTVAYYGEDFIAKYIVDGELAFDLLNDDLLACEHRIGEISNEIVELIEAYHKSYVDDVEDIFVRSGTCTIVRNGSVFLFVQKDELAKLNVKGKNDYMLSLAKRSAFDGSNTNVPNNTVDNTVTGFVIEKIYFDGVSIEIKTDTDVATAIQTLVNNNDLLQFVIYSDVHLTEEDLEDMHYAGFDQWNYPTRTVVSVKGGNINMDAIKELTKRSDVTSVHISALLVPLPDDVVDEPAVDDNSTECVHTYGEWQCDETYHWCDWSCSLNMCRIETTEEHFDDDKNGACDKCGYVLYISNDDYVTIGTVVSDVMPPYAISCKIPKEYGTDNTDIPILLSFGLIEGCDADTDRFSEIVLIAENNEGQSVIIKRFNISEILKSEYFVESVWDDNREWIIGFNYTHKESFALPLSLISGASGQIHIGLYECTNADSEVNNFGNGAYIVLNYARNESSISISIEALG